MRLLCGNRVRRVLGGLAQCVLLPGKLLDLVAGGFIFLLRRFHVRLGGDGRGVAFAQAVPVTLICAGRVLHLCAQGGLALTRLLQPLRVIGLPVVALCQFGRGLCQRPLILGDDVLLEGKPAFQHGKPGGQSFGGVLKAVHSGGSELEIGLRFLDLLTHRLDVAGEVFGIQGKRHDEVAQGFSHEGSLPLSGSDAGPHRVNESGLRLGLLFVLARVPRPNTQKAEQISLIYLGHAPPAFQQGVIGAVYKVRQRQVAAGL